DEFHQAELNCVVAVFIFRAALHDHTWAGLQHRARYGSAVFGEHLSHAEFNSENSVDCHFAVSFAFERLPAITQGAASSAPTFSIRYFAACSRPKALISTSTPGGRSSFIKASTVSGVGSRMSIRRLCVRISNCSRDFLSTCGDRRTVQRLITVGRG